ncbi:MAG: HAMP domain-containing protein [Acidobacteria bacterium]|nr:HAMP domain-containing protein [Acidobacteriota bacterium]
MSRRWQTFLFTLLLAITVALVYQVVAVAKATVAVSLILNLLTLLNLLLILVLFVVLSRNLVRLYLERKHQKSGIRLKSKLVLALMPLTLFPAVLMFILASRLPEKFLSGLSIDANIATLIENSEQLSRSYMEDVAQFHRALTPQLDRLWPDESGIQAMLNVHRVLGVQISTQNQSVWVWSTNADERIRRRVNDLPSLPNRELTLDVFDDGLAFWRIPDSGDQTALTYLYVKDTGYTERLSFVTESYAALDLLRAKRQSISGLYQSTLLILTLSIIFGGIWLGLRFARTFLGAIGSLAMAAEDVRQGNLETTIDLQTGDEIDQVVAAFNSMTQTLKTNQAELNSRADALKQVNEQLQAQIDYTETLVREVSTGILSLDAAHLVKTINPAAAALLQVDAEKSVNGSVHELLRLKGHEALKQQWQTYLQRGLQPTSAQIELGDDAESRMSIHVTMVPLKDGDTGQGHIIVLEDLTTLVNAQKLAAWREVARRVAHEIKNPLTPIQLSAQRIARKASQGADDLGEAVHSAHETIMAEIAILKNLVNDFSTYARLPAPTKERFDLKALMINVRETYESVYPQLNIETVLPDVPCQYFGDSGQIRQVFTNLIHNAAQVTPSGGSLILSLEAQANSFVVAVTDSGPGIPPGDREKIFIPYYSKSAKGTGLGLAIVKRIVEDHGGTIDVVDSDVGARFVVALPNL